MTKIGLRERKKEQTRRTLHEAAVRLFLERGYDQVTVAEIAGEAETALTTLFTYFPDGKVALVFSGPGEDRATALVQAVTGRPAGTDAITAIETFMGTRLPFTQGDAQAASLLHLVLGTPSLRAYARKKWNDCEETLIGVLVEHLGSDADASLRALARLILESPDIAAGEEDPQAALAMVFVNLRRGWQIDGN